MKTIRILHVLNSMNRGGIETWLMHVLRHIDRHQFQMDIAVCTDKLGAYDDEAQALGAKIIPGLYPYPSQSLRYAYHFMHIIRDHGPYDIIHSHLHHHSGFILQLAQQAGVPVRIAHSHVDSRLRESRAQLARRLSVKAERYWVRQVATAGLACSANSAVDMFGPAWEFDPRWKLLYYGIDLSPFRETVNRTAVRQKFNIPTEAFVVGHVGRFEEQKNHKFLLDIVAEVVKRESRIRFLLVGDGPLRPALEAKVRRLNIEANIIFAGLRSDIPQLMLGAMDAFLLPSLFEGLPLVLLEAQAAGLPYVRSDVISTEADIVRGLGQQLPLSHAPSAWAEAIVNLIPIKSSSAMTRTYAFSRIEGSDFNLSNCLGHLKETYSQLLRDRL